MNHDSVDRRRFLAGIAGTAAAASALGAEPSAAIPQTVTRGDGAAAAVTQSRNPLFDFAVIGLNHNHIYAQVNAMLRAGGALTWVYAREPDLLDAFRKQYPQARAARTEDEVLQDPKVRLVLTAAIPDERAPLAVRAMRHGKDFMSDKPGMTTLEQLAEVRKVQAETKRIFSIMFSERFENQATIKAGDLVKAGAIGRVLQTVGLGPHRTNPKTRPAWFFERRRYGGILCDIASHQADQFLFFTGSTRAEVVASQVGNLNHPEYPGLEDFGDMMLSGNGGTGYHRVDWFTPDGLATWGDGRLTILGTAGFIEIRKNIDIAGRQLGAHLFLVDQKETRYIDCKDVVAAVRRPAGRGRVAPHGDGHGAGALLPGHGAGAPGGSPGAPVEREDVGSGS